MSVELAKHEPIIKPGTGVFENVCIKTANCPFPKTRA